MDDYHEGAIGELVGEGKNSINCGVIREEERRRDRNKEMLEMTKGSDGRRGKRNDQIVSAVLAL